MCTTGSWFVVSIISGMAIRTVAFKFVGFIWGDCFGGNMVHLITVASDSIIKIMTKEGIMIFPGTFRRPGNLEQGSKASNTQSKRGYGNALHDNARGGKRRIMFNRARRVSTRV